MAFLNPRYAQHPANAHIPALPPHPPFQYPWRIVNAWNIPANAPAPAKDPSNDNSVCDCRPGELPYINREGRLMPTNDPPYTANTAVGSFRNNEPTRPTTELARTGSAAAESSLDSRKNIVATAPSIWYTIIDTSIGSPRQWLLPVPTAPPPPPPPLLACVVDI